MTDDELPEINVNRLAGLMREYADAGTREREREIENEVLRETVWQIDKDPFASFDREMFEYIRDNVNTNDERVEAEFRRPYLDLLR